MPLVMEVARAMKEKFFQALLLRVIVLALQQPQRIFLVRLLVQLVEGLRVGHQLVAALFALLNEQIRINGARRIP